MTNKYHILWVDYAKGLGIFLVVLGHLIRSFINSKIISDSSPFILLDHWIYAFHMPLFFILSGLFIHGSIVRSSSLSNFLKNRLKSIAYPYFIWSILQGSLQIFFSKYTNHKMEWTQLFRIWYDPIMQYWFLYSLFIIIMTYALLYQINKEKTPLYFLILSVTIYGLKLLNIDVNYLSILYRSWLFSIYFAMGVWIANKSELLSKINHLSIKNAILFSSFGFLILTFGIIQLYSEYNIFKNITFAFIGSISTVFLSIFLEKVNRFNEIKKWGVFSLEIFLSHTIFSAFMRITLQNLLGIHNFYLHLFLGLVAGIYLPILLVNILNRFNIPYIFKLSKT